MVVRTRKKLLKTHDAFILVPCPRAEAMPISMHPYSKTLQDLQTCPNLPSINRQHSLSTLPRIRLRHVRRQSIETDAFIAERKTLELNIDLPRTFLRIAIHGASNKTALMRQRAKRIALSKRPATGNRAFGDAC